MNDNSNLRVSFRKQVSDGNYGTESAEVVLEGFAESWDSVDGTTGALLAAARRMVHAELARSPNARVRQVVMQTLPQGPPPEPIDDDGDDIDELPWVEKGGR